jgi:glycerol-3-phosphate dehydrogenase subunit C
VCVFEHNVPQLLAAIDAGYDVVAPIPSCVLMFRQELPLMYPEDAQVRRVAEHVFDPFEYLMLRHAAGLLRTDFKTALGKVSYHVPCHLRVQNLGLKTRDLLVVQRVQAADCDHYASDCPMAGHQIESGLDGARAPEHPLRLLRIAYGL